MIDALTAALAESEAALEARTEERDDLRDTLAERQMEIDVAWEEITSNPDLKRGEPGELSTGVREACDAAYAQGQADSAPDAPDLLRAYLVSRGLPADPLKLDDPHLDALARALL